MHFVLDFITNIFEDHMLLAVTLGLFALGLLSYLFKSELIKNLAFKIPGIKTIFGVFEAINRRFKKSIFDRVRDAFARTKIRRKEKEKEKKKKKQKDNQEDREFEERLQAEKLRQLEREIQARQIPLPELAPLEKREIQSRMEAQRELSADVRKEAAQNAQDRMAEARRSHMLDLSKYGDLTSAQAHNMKLPDLLDSAFTHARRHHTTDLLLATLGLAGPQHALDTMRGVSPLSIVLGLFQNDLAQQFNRHHGHHGHHHSTHGHSTPRAQEYSRTPTQERHNKPAERETPRTESKHQETQRTEQRPTFNESTSTRTTVTIIGAIESVRDIATSFTANRNASTRMPESSTRYKIEHLPKQKYTIEHSDRGHKI